MNSELILREADAAEIERWNELVARFDRYRVTHTLEWLRSLEAYFRGRPVFLIYEKAGEIVGCLPGLIVQLGFLRLFGSPLPGWQTVSMGPVFDENKVSTGELVAPLAPFLEKRFGVHHIELMTDRFDAAEMETSGYRGRPEYTFRMPLFPGEEKKVLKAMKQSARRNIARGDELGLTVHFRDDEEFVDEVYRQIDDVFIHGGNVVPFGKTRVLEFYRRMREKDRLLALAVYLPASRTCIATGLFTVENRELTLWMWTHCFKYRWYRPTELMTWTAMQKAMERGCESFDLMGRGDFKAKFGAKMSGDKMRWVRSRYGWLRRARDLSEKIYRLQQSLRGKYARRRIGAAG
jgi:hypothetical protein